MLSIVPLGNITKVLNQAAPKLKHVKMDFSEAFEKSVLKKLLCLMTSSILLTKTVFCQTSSPFGGLNIAAKINLI